VVPDYALSPQVRLFLFRRCNDASACALTAFMDPGPDLKRGQLLIIVLARNSAEFGVTVAAIPVVLALLALCAVAVQREIKWYADVRSAVTPCSDAVVPRG
jgi:hypothetical protein